MLDGRVLGASQVEYKPFGKLPLKREHRLALLARTVRAGASFRSGRPVSSRARSTCVSRQSIFTARGTRRRVQDAPGLDYRSAQSPGPRVYSELGHVLPWTSCAPARSVAGSTWLRADAQRQTPASPTGLCGFGGLVPAAPGIEAFLPRHLPDVDRELRCSRSTTPGVFSQKPSSSSRAPVRQQIQAELLASQHRPRAQRRPSGTEGNGPAHHADVQQRVSIAVGCALSPSSCCGSSAQPAEFAHCP